MFTGLIETTGTIDAMTSRGNYAVLKVRGTFRGEGLAIGESISCDGACLTVVAFDKQSFTVEASQETASRTILGTYSPGSTINLERALTAGSRIGGHYVLGHVDCRGSVEYLKPIGESLELSVSFEPRFDVWVIEKGSIAINGVSLTINECSEGRLSVNLVPLTAKETTLGVLKSESPVNLEFDMIGKYVAKMIRSARQGGLSIDTLIKSGW